MNLFGRSRTTAATDANLAATKYRPDIDGLRALAVLPIVLFHIGYAQFAGGYVGVDIFFVISGYLIGRNITNGIDGGDFKLSSFYVSRIKRIFPAFAVMVLVTTLASLLFLFPVSLVDYSKSVLSTLVYGSNIFFWNESGYFDVPAASKPLLHTWSLAVEEQFYLVLPAMLLLFRPFRKSTATILVALVAAVSLVLSVGFTNTYPDAAFYLLPFRAWELLLGVLIARLPEWKSSATLLRLATAAAGFAMIVFAIFFYSEATPFPGSAALLPCVGAGLIILSGIGRQTVLHRGLATWPLRLTGRISYSMYLWHWPLIVLAREGLPAEYFSRMGKLEVLAATFVLGFLSWRFIEEPLRHVKWSKAKVFGGYAAGSLALGALAVGLIAMNGAPERFPKQAVQAASLLGQTDAVVLNNGHCMLEKYNHELKDFDIPVCLKADPTRPNVLLFGDSHVDHFWHGLMQRWPGVNFMMASGAGCQPTLTRPPASTPACDELMDYMFHEYLTKTPPDYVLMAGEWVDSNVPNIVETLAWFKQRNIKVIFVGPTPEWTVAAPRLVAISRIRNDPELPNRFAKPHQGELDKLPTLAPPHAGLAYVYPDRLFCKDGVCNAVAPNGDPILWDTGHLSATGSMMAAETFAHTAPFNLTKAGVADYDRLPSKPTLPSHIR